MPAMPAGIMDQVSSLRTKLSRSCIKHKKPATRAGTDVELLILADWLAALYFE